VNRTARAVDRLLDAVSRLDMASAGDLFADDGVLELPNRADGHPRRIVGRRDVERFLGLLPKLFEDLPLLDRQYYETTDPSVVVVEYRSDGRTRTGRPYHNRYIAILRLDADGKVALWREYFDPTAIAEALGT
jgi:ketosteroid isomerase-like protein